MDSIAKQIQDLAASSNPIAHKQILDTLRDLSLSLETPGDSIQRIIYGAFQPSIARVCCDLKLFEILSQSSKPMSYTELAEQTKVAPLLMNRLLRYTSTVGMTKEVSHGLYESTNIGRGLTKPGIKAGVNFSLDIMTPTATAFPEFLGATGYQDIVHPAKTALQLAFNTTDPAFIYLFKNPEKLGNVMQWMTAQHEGLPTWLDIYPILEQCKSFPKERPLFVDVGGGIGHQCVALLHEYPQLNEPGRIILQDLAPTIAQTIPMKNVKVMEHDFFTPQVIKGARFYYMRNVLHDHPDDKCQIILKQTMSAMENDSVILIDEMALPDTGIHWQAAQLDMLMMMSLGAMERTTTQWHELLKSVGLKIQKIYTYTDLLKDSIIVAVKA